MLFRVVEGQATAREAPRIAVRVRVNFNGSVVVRHAALAETCLPGGDEAELQFGQEETIFNFMAILLEWNSIFRFSIVQVRRAGDFGGLIRDPGDTPLRV